MPRLDGTHQPYINLDNAASTPALKAVREAVDRFLKYYSSVHRGTGFKSQLATHAYEESRLITLRFLGANSSEHTCIFVKNTTEAINKLARRFPFTPGKNVVITTGILNPIHHLAEKTHRAGAMIFIDCAQLAPHHKVEMRHLDDPAHLDFVAISAHKMYAPFGTGALVGRQDIFMSGEPEQRGSGTVEIVTLDNVVWADPPDKEEGGSPNTVGAIALAAAIAQLEKVGMNAIAAYEAELTAYALEKLPSVPGIHIFGNTDPHRASERLGVIPLTLAHVPHFLVAAILGHEFGIGVRSGCFCAHPYILHLLKLTPQEAQEVRSRILAGDRSEMPGMIRASFGLYNTLADVDALAEALNCISRGQYQGKYTQTKSTGEYIPAGWQPDFKSYSSF